jgi:hypothetical protein
MPGNGPVMGEQTFAFANSVVEDNIYGWRVVFSGNPVVGRHVLCVFFAKVVAIFLVVGRDFASLSCREAKVACKA